MFLRSKLYRLFTLAVVICVSFTMMAGCRSYKDINSQTETSSAPAVSSETAGSISSSESKASKAQEEPAVSGGNEYESIQLTEAQKTLVKNITDSAKQGKIINCEFSAKAANIEDVQNKWGKADTSDYVEQAKGTYDSYTKHNAAFGYNKGGQIFEVRSFEKQLGGLTFSAVKKQFGKPGYDYKSSTEEELGYKLTADFKILFVFSLPTESNKNPVLKHYSIFYPAGTINSMAGDPGREW